MKRTIADKVKAFIKGWLYTILISLLIATTFKSVIADWNIVPTGSMKPTIVEGDRILVNKLAYDLKVPYTTWHLSTWDDPQRGEIVVFYSPKDGTRMVKRVVGVPGDRVAMRNNQLYINGEPVVYHPINDSGQSESEAFVISEDLAGRHHPVMITPHIPAKRSFGPVTVPEDQYLLMGDNRDNSADSRYFGFVDRHLIVGRATAVVISLDGNDGYKPRWKRFFTRLP